MVSTVPSASKPRSWSRAPGRRAPLNSAGTLRREVLVEHAPAPVRPLRVGDVGAPLRVVLLDVGPDHLLIGDHLLRLVLEVVEADRVEELEVLEKEAFFLSLQALWPSRVQSGGVAQLAGFGASRKAGLVDCGI
jgi:hypothetical protein